MRRRHARCTVPASLAALLAAALTPHAGAVDFNWDNRGGNGLWATSANWNPNRVPDLLDDLLLTATSLSGAQIIDLAGMRSINAIQANGVNGAYTFTNSVPGGALEFFGPADNSLLLTVTATGSLVFDTDVRYRLAARMFINTNPGAGSITFNAGRT